MQVDNHSFLKLGFNLFYNMIFVALCSRNSTYLHEWFLEKLKHYLLSSTAFIVATTTTTLSCYIPILTIFFFSKILNDKNVLKLNMTYLGGLVLVKSLMSTSQASQGFSNAINDTAISSLVVKIFDVMKKNQILTLMY